jgi:alpha-amylase/alpha-mannosidase (GH57 family)
MTMVALLWHMHQPYYEDLVTREHILPWVRLHALKDYYGMVALLREFPQVRVTFNLVPSLLVQLEAFAAGRAHDRYLEVGLRPAAELTEQDALFMLQNFFHAHRPRMIDVHPRYAELLTRRDDAGTLAAAVRQFSVEDLRDLQVWQKLAWIDPFYLEGDERIVYLRAKQRLFAEADKALLRTVELELLNAVIPAYREAAARGHVELSTSPFYHPILPLLCDTDVYKRTHPQSPMPRERFMRPEDAREQLRRAHTYHERLFGVAPTGVWPSEGSVSDGMVPLVHEAGFQWMATDEQVLANSIGGGFSRDGRGFVEQPERLYTPYDVGGPDARVRCLFRDHALSDLIGFVYAGWPAKAAADDFVSRLAEAGKRYSVGTGGREAVIPIILDGENAWEHFEGGGRPFLRALYANLTSHPEVRTATMAEASAQPALELRSIFPGSWIDANFYIWIGHDDDRRAWGQLYEARQTLDAPGESVDPTALARATDEVLIAEGSDWFWWYGDDHSSDHDLEFDDLFRRHLRNVYRLLQRPVPDDLFVSNISGDSRVTSSESQPTGLITPHLDGEQTSYFEWLGAGAVEARAVAGAMHQTERPKLLVRTVYFGFGADHLHVRIDGHRPFEQLLSEGFEFSLKFLEPSGLRFSIKRDGSRLDGRFWRYDTTGSRWTDAGRRNAGFSAETILEVSLPLRELPTAGKPLRFFVATYDHASNEIERLPLHRAIELAIPTASFAAENWTA